MAPTISEWIEIAKIGGAAIAFSIGLSQYRKSQRWKRIEFVAAEMKVFYDDVAVKRAMTMLDWSRKEVALFTHRGEHDFSRSLVTYELVASALGIDPDLSYDKYESAIREIFERFLEFLARFEGFLDAGVIEKKDLDPYLDYWMKLIAGRDPRSPKVTEIVLPQLWKFIDFYGYADVRNFVGRYQSVAFPPSK